MFAIAVDPRLRSYLAAITIRSSGIGVFADEFALALRHFGRHIGIVMHLFRRWRGAFGLSLKNGKSSVIMGTEEKERDGARRYYLLEIGSPVAPVQAQFAGEDRRAARPTK